MSIPREKNLLDKFLSIFTRVNPGEGVGVILLALNVFLLLGAYYILKTVREPLILAEGGAERATYSAAVQALALFFVVPAYGWIASRMPRLQFISTSTLFFVLNLAVFFLLINAGAGSPIGFIYYVWLGIFNVFVVAQFWSFANDLYSEEAGKRLFPIVGVGASVGAWIGALSAERLFERLQVNGMLALAAAGLLAALALTWLVNSLFRADSQDRGSDVAAKPLGKQGGFELVLKDSYLRLIAILIFLLNVVNTMGEYILRTFVKEQAVVEAAGAVDPAQQATVLIGQFYGGYYSIVNLLSLVFQLFLVPYLFRWIGVRGALFILPCIALGGYSLLIAYPLLAVIRVAKILENATDYSIQNTTRQALFLLTSREAKYKAKAAIDTFFVRTGDMLTAGLVGLGINLGFSITNFAMVNAALVLGWLGVAGLLFREHKRRSQHHQEVERAA